MAAAAVYASLHNCKCDAAPWEPRLQAAVPQQQLTATRICYCCCCQVAYDITTSVAEAVEQMASLIRLTNFQTFTLYEATRPINFKASAEPPAEEHMLLDENR